MDRIQRLAVPATALLVSFAPAQQAATAYGRIVDRALAAAERKMEGTNLWADHSTWADPWVATTDHFSVRTTRSYGEAKDLAIGLEAMLGHFQQTLATDFAPAQPFHVFVLPDIAAYNQFGDANGEHHSSFYGSFFAPGHAERPVAVAAHDNPTWLRMQITHSVVHQYLAAAYPGRAIPTWLDEGLAAYFSTYWNYGWTLDEFERLKSEGQVPGLTRLLRDGVDRYGADAHARLSSLGMLFYYLFRFREDSRTIDAGDGGKDAGQALFRDYVTATLEGRPVESLPFHALVQDLDALERDWLAYEYPR